MHLGDHPVGKGGLQGRGLHSAREGGRQRKELRQRTASLIFQRHHHCSSRALTALPLVLVEGGGWEKRRKSNRENRFKGTAPTSFFPPPCSWYNLCTHQVALPGSSFRQNNNSKKNGQSPPWYPLPKLMHITSTAAGLSLGQDLLCCDQGTRATSGTHWGLPQRHEDASHLAPSADSNDHLRPVERQIHRVQANYSPAKKDSRPQRNLTSVDSWRQQGPRLLNLYSISRKPVAQRFSLI